MANETKIEPALTADEWRPRLVMGDFHAPQLSDENEGLGMPKLWIEDARIVVDTSSGEYTPASLPPEKVMALANAALPDDDPRKITRKDVDLLRLLLRAFAPDDKVRDWLPALADKLAVLLPPE